MADRLIARHYRLVSSDPGIELFVREVRSGTAVRPPLLLVHGGGPGGLASFDLGVAGYSLAVDLAVTAHTVYVMDVRGWGRSTRPAVLAVPPGLNPPAVRSDEVARDIGAVVAAIRDLNDAGPVALVGWATGGHWCALYASDHPEAVSGLVMINSLYGVDAPWGLRAAFEAEDHPGTFDAGVGAYVLRTGAGLLGGWDRSIPMEDKAEWRDPRVAAAYVAGALTSDPQSDRHDPPAMRTPAGFQADSYLMSRGHRFWEAAALGVPTLVIRGERDFWSRPEDVEALQRELTNAPRFRTVTIPDATHHLHLDRPDRGRRQLLEEIGSFLAAVTGTG